MAAPASLGDPSAHVVPQPRFFTQDRPNPRKLAPGDPGCPPCTASLLALTSALPVPYPPCRVSWCSAVINKPVVNPGDPRWGWGFDHGLGPPAWPLCSPSFPCFVFPITFSPRTALHTPAFCKLGAATAQSPCAGTSFQTAQQGGATMSLSIFMVGGANYP